MKLTIKTFSLLFVICSLLLSTCSNPVSGGRGNGGGGGTVQDQGPTGTLTINLGGEGRAAGAPYPPTDANGVLIDLVNHIQLQGPTGSQNRTIEKGATSASFTVAPGLWHITVDSYHGSDHYATGTNSIDVKAGQDNSTVISMSHIHLWVVNGSPLIAPTCAATGIGPVLCTPCGKTEASGIIPATGLHIDPVPTGYCTVCSALTLSIGDTGPGGGKIFYKDTLGFTVEGYTGAIGPFAGYTAHYLEAALADVGSFTWGGGSNAISTNSQIGTGRRNTARILDVDPSAPAANACDIYSNNGQMDWFLPSSTELLMLHTYRIGVGMTSGFYWSSTSLDTMNAYRVNFGAASIPGATTAGRTTSLNVRPIRAF